MSCSRFNCNGGQGFEIKNKMFCSPSCGNKYYDLQEGDEDYWSNETNDEDDDEEEEEYEEKED